MTQAPQTTAAPADTVLTPSFVAVLISRVQWLVRLRWVYAVALAVVGLIGLPNWDYPPGYYPKAWLVLILAGIMAGYNLVVWAALGVFQRGGSPERSGAFVRIITDIQIALDLGIFITLFYDGLGLAAYLMIPHMAIAASLLPRLDAYIQASAASAAIFVWMWGIVPARFYSSYRELLAGGPEDIGLAVLSMATAGALSAMFILTVWFTKAILTRLRNINRRLTQANEELAQLDRAKSRFLRLSSHQLRGNVAAIHSMLGAMQAVGPLADRQADLARRIRLRAGELVVQMDEMLLLSTIRENGVEIQKRTPVDLAAVLRSAAEAASGEAIIHGLTLTLEGCSDPVHVQAWSGALETVFSNLLSNAVKYTPRGGQVSLSLRRRHQRAQVETADTGIGILDSMHEQVFQEFYRAPQARQIAGGTGLGLPIVRAILDKLGGQIRLASGEGPGTVVTVELPLVEPGPSAQPAAAAPVRMDETDKRIPVEKARQTASTLYVSKRNGTERD